MHLNSIWSVQHCGVCVCERERDWATLSGRSLLFFVELFLCSRARYAPLSLSLSCLSRVPKRLNSSLYTKSNWDVDAHVSGTLYVYMYVSVSVCVCVRVYVHVPMYLRWKCTHFARRCYCAQAREFISVSVLLLPTCVCVCSLSMY